MPRAATLSPVLAIADLPSEELQAARLDGELYGIDEGFGVVDVVDTPWVRAASLAAIIPHRLIAELATATWLLGASDQPPSVHELCTPATSRYRATDLARVRLREVCLDPSEIVTIGAVSATSPLRTAVDLLRFRDHLGPADVEAVLRLAEVGGFGLVDAEHYLRGRRHLPAKVRALHRLEGLSRR
ncbi:MAG: hypothetical protein RI885_1010 [Actinomycetota bacterium]|jgi:hypothetical protein